jgi:hypothetical protein
VGLAILGVLIYSLMFGSMPGWNFTGFGSRDSSTLELVVDKSFSAADISEVKIDLASDDCNVYTAADNSFTVRHYVRDIPESRFVSAKVDGGALKISSGIGNAFSFGISINRESLVEIYVPEGWRGKLDTDVTSGSVTLEDAFEYTELALHTTSGEILSGYPLKAEEAEIDVTSGSIRLTGGLEAGEYKLKTTSGEIDVDERLTGSGRIEVTSGSVNLFGVEIAKRLSVDVSSGDVEMELAGDPGLEFTARKTSGDIETYFDIGDNDRHNYSATIGSAPYKELDIEVTSGSIRITQE